MKNSLNGRIIKIISNLYSVESNGIIYECRARGKFRNENITPLVGDNVLFDKDELYILEILDRKNEIIRPSVCNVDACIIVTSVKKPDFSAFLLDKMITNVMLSNVEPIIVLSKCDLLDSSEVDYFKDLLDYYNNIGIKTLYNTNIEKLEEYISGKVVALTGQTGAGKSTLINKLDESLELATDEISLALGRGKHTTRHVELFKIKDYYVVDTPGFSALDINENVDNIRYTFPEFKNDECKFRDCKHINEIGCAVKRDMEAGLIKESRYESYKKMVV